MAARTVKTKKTTKVTRKVVATKPVAQSKVTQRRSLSGKQKLLLAGTVLVLAFVIYSVKDLFVAATVNGYPLSRLAVVRELEKQGGQQVLDNLINEMIIVQEARKANIVVDQADIDAKVEEVRNQIAGQGQDLDTVLAARGMSQEDLRKQLETQVALERLLSDKVSVTDEEVSSFLESNKEFMPEGLTDQEYKELAINELKQEKLSTSFSTWLEEVKAASTINYFVEY